MGDVGNHLAACVRCRYPVAIEMSPGTRAMCPECGTLNTGDDLIRRAQRRRAYRLSALIVLAFVAMHVMAIVSLAKFGGASSLVRSVAFPAGAAAALLATVLSAFGAGLGIAKVSRPHRADAVLPAYVVFTCRGWCSPSCTSRRVSFLVHSDESRRQCGR